MKCRLIIETEIYRPHASPELIAQCVERGPFLFAPPGTIIEGPDCWLIVLMGRARPADEECEAKTKRPQEQIDKAEYAAIRLAKGIHPDDFERYDRGELVGYAADGRDIISPQFQTDNEGDDE